MLTNQILKNYTTSFCIGETLHNFPNPVFFDTHYAIVKNLPPVTTITGRPGSGKTFLGLLLTALASIQDKLTFVFDPKGDFGVLKRLEKYGITNKISFWSLFDNNEVSEMNYGVLDPTVFYDKSKADDNATITIDLIKTITSLSEEQEHNITPIVRDVCNSKTQPSFNRLVNRLKEHRNKDVRQVGTKIDLALKNEMAKLLSLPVKQDKPNINFGNGTIIINLMGLKLPDIHKDPAQYKMEEKLSIAIINLLVRIVLDTLKGKEKNIRKLLVIDEAWTIMRNESTLSMLNSVSLMGRSLNMATLLLTQSPRHIPETIQNTISSQFAFSNDSIEDNKITIKNMSLDSVSGWETVLTKLQTGQCLYSDTQKEIGLVHIFADEDWEYLFNNNPTS